MAGKSESRKPIKKKPIWVRRLKQASAFGTIVFLTAFAGLFVMFLLKLRDAEEALQTPEFQDRMDAVSRPPTRILTRDAVELYRVSSEFRLPVKKLDDIPEHVRRAILAAEDKRFYEHKGVDSMGLMRAFVSIFKDGRVSQGGSTLTMQLAKLLYNGNEKSFRRKVEDIAYAYAIEKYKTKDQILLLYLNKVYFGENAHGIKAAAKVYFNKDVKDLTVGEAAMLARSVQRPSQYNPIKNFKESLRDRDTVLAIMKEEGWLNDAQYQKGLNESPKLNPKPPKTTAKYANFGQHFVRHVLSVLEEEMPDLDIAEGGYTIYTTIDSKLQKHAESVVRKYVAENNNSYRKVNQGAFVAMNSDGQILVEVGGVDFKRSQYNIVTQGRRQPGSSFKAFVYAAAFQTGALYGPQDMVSNVVISRYNPDTGDTWTPRNSASWETASAYPATRAFAASINRCAIHMIDEVGPKHVAQMARDSFGIKSELYPGSPLALGSSAIKPLELLEGYGVFMLGGDRVKPYPITRIVAPDGDVVRQYQPQRYVGVLSAAAAANMNELMRAVVMPGGTARAAAIVPNAKGKTGTTNNHRDAWFAGYTDGLVGVGWVGNQRKDGIQLPMGSSTYGGTVTAHIWADIMKVAHEKYSKKDSGVPPSAYAAAVPKASSVPEETVRALGEDEPTIVPADAPVPPETGDINPPPAAADLQPPSKTVEEIEREREAAEREAEQRREAERARELERIVNAERERERRRQADRQRQEQDVTSVEICADSGMVANRYCPEVVTRSYQRGRAPNRRCRLHGPG